MNKLEANLNTRTIFDLKVIRMKAESKRSKILMQEMSGDQLPPKVVERNGRAFRTALMVTGIINNIFESREVEALNNYKLRYERRLKRI